MKLYRIISYSVTLFILLFGFFLFYSYTKEPIGSLFASVMAAILTYISFVIIGWFIQAV